MPKWTEYTTKETLADNDEVMLYDATARANKRGLMSKFWDYVVDKMATAVISKLKTDNKTIIGAINALYSESKMNYNKLYFGVIDKKIDDLNVLSLNVPDGGGEAVNCAVWFGNESLEFSYISAEKRIISKNPATLYSITMQSKTSIEIRHENGSNFANNWHGFFITRIR